MQTIVLILFVFVCLLLMLVILLQPGKGGGLGGMGGGGGGGPAGGVFGSRGAVPFLSKMTVYLGVGFAVLVLVLSGMSHEGSAIGELEDSAIGVPASGDAPTDGAAAPANDGAAPAAPVEAPAAPAEGGDGAE